MKKQLIILGIETSCDETAASVVRGVGDKVEVLSNVVSSQIEIHKKYGGVVPEVAAREHVLNILPVVNEALAKAGIKSPLPSLGELGTGSLLKGAKKIDAIAVTVGPGLVTSLLVGVETAKTLAYAWGSPVVAVNHIEGHIYANWLRPISEIFNFQFSISKRIQNTKYKIQDKIKFPAIILTVSGGHTMLVLMSGHGKYRVLGETRDDAAGEAFDKAAQLLGLGYPGGPAVAAEAVKARGKKLKDISLPRPMINSGDYDFSFSGLKTALWYAIQRDKIWKKRISGYAYEFEQAAVEVLVSKIVKAARDFNCQTIMLSGGVAANLELRNQLAQAVKNRLDGAKLIIPEFKYCTDNAAMIAAAGYFRAKRKDFTPWQKLKTEPNKEFI
ncbi:MAG: tRNA (adenosine(37)-N6)-threonylcarbamoyltransferase complex transferase subunit TsaD [bacterium]|nr:tRNA (adenosine(37)-N6)-threonylcarbamoyltransferase complex transferase subunit TsaD [bacterium]